MKSGLFSAVIDKITSSIEEVASGKNFDTYVLPVTIADLKGITKKAGWLFNWKAEARQKDGRVIYKLVTVDSADIIHGLISFKKDQGFYFMELIEAAPFNLGSKKNTRVLQAI
jgi:hypothetical protein